MMLCICQNDKIVTVVTIINLVLFFSLLGLAQEPELFLDITNESPQLVSFLTHWPPTKKVFVLATEYMSDMIRYLIS